MDENACIALCEKELPMLFRMAMSLLHTRADAEDAVQTALLKMWQHRRKAREGAERAWVMRILINECYTLLRRRKHFAPLEDASLLSAPEPTDGSLNEAIRALPEPLRTPLLLKYMAGMTEKEVASSLHLSVGAVKNRLYRARQALKTLLNEEVAP